MEWVNELQELAAWAMPILVGGGAAVLVNWLKNQFNIPDKEWLLGFNARAWLTVGVALGLGLLSHFAEGAFDPDALTVGNLAETIIMVITTSTAMYFKVLKKEEPDVVLVGMHEQAGQD